MCRDFSPQIQSTRVYLKAETAENTENAEFLIYHEDVEDTEFFIAVGN